MTEETAGRRLLDICASHRVATPALIVDEGVLLNNISAMAAFARRASVALRPHAKTHKSSYIAGLQRQAGAVGASCATLVEAMALHAGGVEDLLVTSPLADRERAALAAGLHRRARLTVVVDHRKQIDDLVAVLREDDAPLDILVDVDVGQARTGVTRVGDAVGLARLVMERPKLSFAGLQGFGGHIQHTVAAAQREAGAAGACRRLRDVEQALAADGVRCRCISGSGTGAFLFDARGPYTELQVGSYLFMDADYRRLEPAASDGPRFEQSLFVLGTVVSANREGQVSVDAGVKALAVNGPAPDMLVGAPAGSRYQFAGDEHGVIHLPDGARPPELGAHILLAATHCDPTVNNFSRYLFVTAADELTSIAIEGRY